MLGTAHRHTLSAATWVAMGTFLALPTGAAGSAARHDGTPSVREVGASAPALLEAPHNIRMSIGSLETGPGTISLEVRFFWDDLQMSVMERTSDMAFELAETPAVDGIVQDYINDMLTLEVEGTRLQGRVVARGVQDAPRPDEVMWWYRLEYSVDGAPERLYVKNRLLFNMFEDQRNILHVTTRSGRERAYYFSWAEDDVTVPLR